MRCEAAEREVSARLDGELRPGEEVEITAVDGLTLEVRPVDSALTPSGKD